MKLVKITAGRHQAWFEKRFADGGSLLVKKPYLPPEGCHKACGLVGEAQKPEPRPEPRSEPQVEVPAVKLSWLARVLMFLRRLFKGRIKSK